MKKRVYTKKTNDEIAKYFRYICSGWLKNCAAYLFSFLFIRMRAHNKKMQKLYSSNFDGSIRDTCGLN